MEKTAMEDLIEYIELRKNQLEQIGEYTLRYQYCLLETKAQSLLPKEREQIEEAWDAGNYNGNPMTKPSDYFTQKYGHGKD